MKRIALILTACLIAGFTGYAQAQTATGDVVISWTAPTSCTDGSPITNCPITSYEVEKLSGTTWTRIASTTPAVLSFRHVAQPLGSHQYRALAVSAIGKSQPTNPVTAVIAVPNAPGSISVTVTVTINP